MSVAVEKIVLKYGRLALSAREAAKVLGIGRTTLWKQANRAATDPSRINRTSYGTYPVMELVRHLSAEMRQPDAG